MGIADILFLGVSSGLIISLFLYQAISNQISLNVLWAVFLVIWGFVCWLIYILRLPNRLNKVLYSRSIH